MRTLLTVLLLLLATSPAWTHPGHAGRATPRQVAFDPDRTDTRVIVSSDVGLHITHDDGQSYTWVCEEAMGYDVLDFAFVGSGADKTWLVASRGWPRNPDGEPVAPGVWLSTDEGCSWNRAKGAVEDRIVHKFSVNPKNRAEVVAVVGGRDKKAGIVYSEDAGRTFAWSNIQAAPLPIDQLLRAPSDPSRLYAASPAAILRSDDGGRTWKKILTALTGSILEDYQLHEVDEDKADHLYFSVHGKDPQILYLTKDGGSSATKLFTAPKWEFSAFATQEGDQETGRRFVIASSTGTWHTSDDEGATWKEEKREGAVALWRDPERPKELLVSPGAPVGGESHPEGHHYVLGRLGAGSKVERAFSYGSTGARKTCPEDKPGYTKCTPPDWIAVAKGTARIGSPEPAPKVAPPRPEKKPEPRATPPKPAEEPEPTAQPEEASKPWWALLFLLLIPLGIWFFNRRTSS